MSGDLKAKNLTVNTATVSAAKIEVNQAATVNTAATITAPTQTYMDAVTVNANTTINASSNLTFGSDGTVGGTGSIIVSGNGTVNIQKNINLTGGTSKFEQTGTGAVNIGNVSSITAATQTYTGAVTLNTDTEFNTSTALTFKNTVSGSQKITLSGTGNVNIGNNITLNGNNGIIEQTGSGSITIDGSLSSVLLTPPVKISAYEQTYQKSVTINTDTEFHAETSVKFLSNISAVGKNIGFWGQSATTQAVNAGTMTSHASERLTLNGAVNLSGSLYTGSNTYNSSVTGERDIEVNGTWQHSGTGNITAKGNVKAGTFTQMAADSTLVFGGSTPQTLQIGPASQIQNLENNGNLKLNSDITIIGKFENNGTFDATTSLSPPAGYTVTLTNGADHTITGTGNAGNTKFHNLSLTGAGGKTLTINGKISVNGILKLEGTNAGSLLTIAGGTNSPGIKLSADQANGKWLNVHTNIPMIPESGGKTYTVTESKDHEVSGFLISDGHPKNWIFSSYAGPMTWKGNHSSNCSDWQNWRPYGIPGVNSDVTIPQKEAAAHYPKLTANVSAKSVTVNSGAELDLDGYLINTTGGTAKLINKGHLKLTGTTGQKNWFENANDANKMTVEANSIVEYYGNTPATSNIWAGPYQNLRVSGATTGFTTEDLKVNEYFTVNTTDSFIINADSQLYTKMVTLNKPTTFSSTNADGTVFKSYLKTNGNAVGFSGTGKIETKDDVYGYGNITVNTGTGAWNSSGKIEANIINTHRNWTSTKDVTANSSITATDWTAKNVTLKGNLTAVQFNQTAGTLTFNGTGTPEQELKFTGAGDKKINHLTIDTGAKVKLGSEIEVKGTFLNNGTFNANNKNIILNGFCTNSGTFNTGTSNTITFKGASFTNSGTFTAGATNTVTLNPTGSTVTITGTGTASATTFRNLSLTGAGGKTLTINKKISVLGNLTLTGTSTDKLTIEGSSTNSSITLSSANSAKGQFLKVRTNIPITGGTYKTLNSFPYALLGDLEIGDGNPEGWIFEGYAGPMTWKGNYSSNWSDWQNWRPYGTPGVNSDVTIPQKEAAAHYPKLTANVSAKSVTVNSEAELDLDGQIIKKGTGSNDFTPLTNNGTLKMTGTSSASDPKGQKEWFENATITFTDNSTVEYYGNTPATSNIWAGPYENLKVSGGKTSFTTGNLIVNKAFTVDTTGSFTINAGSQNYKGAVELKKETTFKSDLPSGTIFENNLNTFGNSITFDGNGEIKTRDIMLALGSGTITVKEGTGGWTSAGQITVKDIIVKRNWISSSHITASGDITADNTAHTNIWTSNFGDIKLTGDLTAAQLNQTGGTLTFNGSGTEQTLSFTNTTPTAEKNIYNLTINTGAKVKLASDITIQGNFTNNGTFDATTAPGYTVTLTNADHTITGTGTASNTKFNNLSLTGAGGKTLTITGNISVNGNLTLQGSGAADAQLLTIDGNASGSGIALSAANTAIGKYLKVRTNIHITTDSHKYQADSSKPYTVSGDPEIGINNPKNWIFDDCLIEMKWLGGSGTTDPEKTAWSAPKNWLPNGIPGIHTDVKIESGKTYYPKLTANVKAKTITLNGELDLDSYTISDDAGGTSRSHIDNKGKLKMTGTAGSPTDQKTWLEIPTSNIGDCITHNDSSIVEYYGSTNNNVWKGPYKNLSLNNRPDLKTNNEDLTVNGVLTVTGSGIHIKTGTGTQTYNGIIAATGKDITLEGSTITTKHNITANNIKVLGDWNSNSGNITAGTNIEAAKWNSKQGSITAGADIIVTGDWYSERSIISGINITSSGSKWTSWGGITATGNIDIENELAFTGGRITVGGNLAAKKLNAYSDAYSGGLIFFNGSGTRKLSGAGGNNIIDGKIQNLEIKSGVTLKLESDITITVGLNNQGEFDAVTKSKKVRLVHAAGLLTPPVPPNNITIKGNTSAVNTKFHNLECTNAGGKTLTINGKISVNGDLKLEGTNDGSLLTIEGGTNSSGIQLAASQTGNGKWLNVHTNIPMIPEIGGKTYTVTESKAQEVPGFLISDGHPKNWIFNDYIGSMSWTALESLDADKTKWDKPKNWCPNGIPGTHTKVNIPTGINKYPKLENSTNAKAKKITLEGELDLAGYVITDTSNTAPLTNNGLLKMTGTADQKTWFENSSSNDKITLVDNSTVQYDSGSSANVFSGPYENLILNGSITAASSLTVNKKTTVNTAATITAPAQTYGGDVRINANTTFSAINSITFSHAIGASANNVTFDGNGTINTQKLSAADITVNSGTGAWTSSGSVTADNINTQRDWISSDDVTAAGNITSNNAWTASSGNIALKGNLSANQFTQTGGTLIFNGNGTPQTLLFTNPAGQKNIYNLIIDTGATLELRSDITIKRDFTNKGTFNADTHTVTLTNDADHKIIGTNTAGDTKFYNLFCEDAGDKTLTFENEIWVEEKMYLSGSYSTGIKPLNIDGNGVISLNNNHPIPGNVSITNIRQKFLRVFSNKVKIGNNKYYGTDESTDDQGTTKNNNGWVFYKTFELVNSFAIPGKNEIYLLFKNGSANNVYTELTEADLANPNFTPLIITDGSSHVYAENRLYIPERLPLPSAIKEHTFWKFTLNNSISPDWILNQNALVSLDYYDRKKQKLHISDIGIDMITPQRASNSIVLRSFDASEDDKALPRLDVTILAEKKGASNNAQLYFYSKDSAEHKLWHPGTVPIGPPPRFAVPQAGTTNYGCTLENNLLKSIISEQDVHLEPNKVGGFMYIYDGWLPCARLRNSNDILSFDVWHFKIVGVQKQKGGVSIFDNVLDPYKGQETIIAAHLQKPGMLTIQIMSIDGSIIRTIERSYKAAGDHIYFWDGKNNGGNPVARGIYFVRIAGPDIDEIRKILVVKN